MSAPRNEGSSLAEKYHDESLEAVPGGIDPEEQAEYQKDTAGPLKLDSHGLPLIPQPSDSPSDPLNWSRKRKYLIVLQVSLLAFFGSFSLAVANPAYAQIATSLGISVNEATYVGTSSIATAGVGSLIYVPFSNVYGRRPVMLFAQLLAVVAGFGSAAAKSYGGLVAGRCFVGLGVASANVLSVNVISDIFCLHERGTFVGLATVALINGPHVASLPGGFIAQYVGYRWTFYLPAITAAAMWFLILFCLPETLYVRETKVGYPEVKNPIMHRMRPWGIKHPGRRLHAVAFLRPFQMLKYFPIVLVAWYGAVAFTLGSVMPAQTVSALFRTFYKWKSGRTGLALSLSTTIGGVLGEVVAGPVADWYIARSRKRTGHLHPEVRLKAMLPGVFLLPAGLLIFGFCIRNYKAPSSYVGVCVAMAITCFSTQIIISPTLSYAIDCYKPQAGEVILMFNAGRQIMSFTVGFWSLKFGEKVGFQFSGLTYALVSLFFFCPVLAVMLFGERWRHKLGHPNFNKGI